MHLHIDHHSGVPAYRQLMEQIQFQIGSGALRAGDEMPSTRALSAELDLNPMTISKAYSLLQREGVLERQRGKPLIIKAIKAGDLLDSKREQLGKLLSPSVTAARQLGITKKEALKIFRELLDEDL